MDNLLQTLDALLQRFLDYLNTILRNLDLVREYLLRKLERLVQFIERIVRKARQFLRIIVSYVLIFVPPALGLLFSFGRSSAVLLIMTMLLVLLLAYAFITRRAVGTGPSLLGDRSAASFSSSTQTLAFLITVVVLIVTYSISRDMFIGVLMFIGEFAIVYLWRASNWESFRA
jgi:hypothetical protein